MKSTILQSPDFPKWEVMRLTLDCMARLPTQLIEGQPNLRTGSPVTDILQLGPDGIYVGGGPQQFTILHLIKIYDDERWADAFLKGQLHLKRLSCFKKLESGGPTNAGRADPNEAVAVWLQNAWVEFKDHPGLNIAPTDLAKAITMSFEAHNDLHVFCLSASHTGRFECEKGLISSTESEIDELKMQLGFDVAKFQKEFGKLAIVVNPVEFILRVRRAVEQIGYTCNSTLVEYIDAETVNGPMPWKFIPFRKEQKYSWQKEYRIAVDTKTKGKDPILLDKPHPSASGGTKCCSREGMLWQNKSRT